MRVITGLFLVVAVSGIVAAQPSQPAVWGGTSGMTASILPMTAQIDYGTARYVGCAYPGDLVR